MDEGRNIKVSYHIIFWVIYIVLWSMRDLVFHSSILANIFLNIAFILTVAPFIYLNLYFLVPKYLLKKKWTLFSLWFSFGFLVVFFTRYYAFQFIFIDILNAPEPAEQFSSGEGVVIIVSENLTLVVITMALFLIREWYIKEKYARELEQKHTESELNLLKSQLQPHFLFNNLNTIYFLMETNPELAKEVMIQFSDVLSHQLYNAKKDKVSLKEELESLENYIKIQQIRHQDFLEMKYHFPAQVDNLQIAPMILLTFIENAFKHSQRETGYYIDISIAFEADVLHLYVANSIGPKKPDQNGGLGLGNVQRRLSLIYPDRYTLQIDKKEDKYVVDLTIKLEPDEQA